MTDLQNEPTGMPDGAEPQAQRGLSPFGYVILVVVVALIVVLGLQLINTNRSQPTEGLAPDFTLQIFDELGGGEFTLSEQRGKVVLLFFGYTHCPDVCPTTLYDYKQIKERLGDDAAAVRFVFITVDPERDTRDLLQKYVTTFDPEFVALSDDRANLEPVYAAYGVYAEKNDVGSAAGYLIDHTARIYVIDPAGDLRLTFPFGMPAEAMAADVAHLLRE